MANSIKVGDLFMSSNELYRVTHVQQSKHFPTDPYLEVDVWVAGRGWADNGDIGFLYSEAEYQGLKFFKETEL